MKTEKNFIDEKTATIPHETEMMMDMSIMIGRKISEFLVDNKMTKREFARSLGKSETQVSGWFGGGHNFTLKTLAEISTVFGIDFSEVFRIRSDHNFRKVSAQPTKSPKTSGIYSTPKL